MSDPMPNVAPIVAPSQEDTRREREQAAMRLTLTKHDAARAQAPRVTLVCLSPFTVHTDDFPEGFCVNRGDFYEISEFDLQRHTGRGRLPGPDIERAPPVISL